jgi:hypothetical protein
MKPAFLLIHSPLVGPYTWIPAANALERSGYQAVVPHLVNNEQDNQPFAEQHVQAIAQAYIDHLQGKPVILAAHSGAGMLLPSAGQAIGSPAGYIFVDAGMPQNNKSRLDLFAPDEADRFRQAATNGYIPLWKEEVLSKVIPDPQVRHTFVSELRPVPIAVYEEQIPVPESWPDAPCAYLSFSKSTSYAVDIKQAREQGWPYIELSGYHFHQLVDPKAVAEALVLLAQQIVKS